MTTPIPEKVLNDGVPIPAIGFGTFRLQGNKGADAVKTALDNGYRLIDTAYNYENEGAVGEGISRSLVPRSDMFITSKLPGRYQTYNEAVAAIQESLYRTHLDYYDLYLIHWPNPQQGHYVEAWEALIEAQKWGLIRSIGVCNFLPEHLERLETETGVKPSINQIELHPFFNQEAQRAYHAEHNITTQSWSPLAKAEEILQNETLNAIAKRHGKTVSQIILRWQYELGNIAIPKSASVQRQRENIAIFDFALGEADMNEINALSRADGRLNDQDPATYEEF
ncbi:aldo/keto reductase [Lentibacillus sp. JNUCC-1]|uniref:aldo/keto reductase n=1 Tax=Lentibacillus sp. JNUCC-1 TaxID=2654513 RepID=UPI0012E75500|nr:aldo/keto reductase [Lentibacillus sp. JNUCC-1]